jgi:hypothetical protein
MASEFITTFTPSSCWEMVELEGQQPMINILPHLTLHWKGIFEK